MLVWNKVTEKLPPEETEVLVYCNGHWIGVLVPEFFKEEDWIKDLEKKTKEDLLNQIGRFKEFGQSYYFTNDKLYWAELPNSPNDA